MTLFPSQDSFTRGEISPRLHSRASLELYRGALAKCENFLTLPHGGIRKRGGTYLVNPTKNVTGKVRLIDFRFSAEQAYCLEFGHQYVRIFAYGAYLNIEVATPWQASELADIQYVQSADVMWIVHPNYFPRKLTRVDATTWTISTVSFVDGPFAAVNTDESKTAYVSAVTGSITITASSGTFTANDVGKLFKIEMESYRNIKPWEPNGKIATDADPSSGTKICRYDGNVYFVATDLTEGWRFGNTPPTHMRGTEPDGQILMDSNFEDMVGVNLTYRHSGFGVARITGYTNSSTVTATVLSRFPDEVVGSGNASFQFSFGAFGIGNFPTAVALFEERLFFANKLSVYGSKTGDFNSFRVGAADDDGLEFLLAANEANDIVWLADADGFLAIGTVGGVRALSGSGLDEALTPSSFKNRSSATSRCAKVRPLNTGQAFLYVAGGERSVSEMVANSGGRFESADASLVSEHILKQNGGAVDGSYQEAPDSLAWFSMASGQLAGFTYQRDQEVRGWHRQVTDGAIESVCVTPGLNGVDDVWVVVSRTIGGEAKRFVEILQPAFEYGDKRDVFAVDCGLTYSGPAVGTVTGLSHLNGATVNVLADGFKFEGLTVSGGSLTLPGGKTAQKIHVGLPFTASADTLELDVGARDGSLMGRRKRVTQVILSLFETDLSGLTISSVQRGKWEPVKNPSIASNDGSMQLYTGTISVPVDDSWDGGARISVRHTGAGPCTVRAATTAFDNTP